MIKHRYALILISMAMISGWVTLSGSSVFQETETPTPTETVIPSFTPTMPWCEYTPTKRYQDVIPVFEFGATSTIDPLATETPTPAPTETIVATETPGVPWVGKGRYYQGEQVKFTTGVNSTFVERTYSSEEVCGRSGSIVGASSYYHVNGVGGYHSSTVRYYGGDTVKYWSVGYYDVSHGIFPSDSELFEYVYPLMYQDRYPYDVWVNMAGSLSGGHDKFTYGCFSSGKPTGWSCSFHDIRFYCLKSEIVISTEVPTATPEYTVTPNCRPYDDLYIDYEPFAEFDYNYIGNTCISLFNGIELSLDDLPSMLLDAMDFLDSTGIFDISAVPELEVSGLEVCLDQYEPIITLMDMDLVTPLSIMITLVVIGGLINEFRS